ncbi:hypothetical protein L4D08_17450, partial [Photobacterium chitinilyticum]|uniref:hypothetical protein n=1 Tax=Photobacterium chitinilyticum TaxID=2485123 RepID=UPI003D0F5895
ARVGGGRGGHQAACELYGLAGSANMPKVKGAGYGGTHVHRTRPAQKLNLGPQDQLTQTSHRKLPNQTARQHAVGAAVRRPARLMAQP